MNEANPGELTTRGSAAAVLGDGARPASRERAPFLTLAIVGLGGLFAGVTGPLLSTFVPIIVRDALGDQRTIIGAVMAIDNFLLLLLVPWMGILSDRAANRGKSRRPIVLAGFLLAAAGMALFPSSGAFGLWGVIAAIVVLYSGINIQRSPFQALVADVVPSRHLPLATGSVTFQMCVGAIVFLMLGRILGMERAFLAAAATVLFIAAAFALALREREPSSSTAVEATFRSLIEAVVRTARDFVPGIRAVFIASVLLQMIFQSFTTWFALHGTERFGVSPADVTIGFIAWAIGGVVGALPAGVIGVRIGRRNALLLGFALMAAIAVAVDRVASLNQAIPLLALCSAAWALPMVNAYPLFIEQIPRHQRGVLAALFLLSMAIGGALGDPLNGRLFDFFDGYRTLFLNMTVYAVLAFVTVLFIPKGAGEAGSGAQA